GSIRVACRSTEPRMEVLRSSGVGRGANRLPRPRSHRMSTFQHDSALARTFKALRKDLLSDGGAQISTTRNYNFAILPYDPKEEFALRAQVSRLSAELRDAGWSTATIALNSLLLERLRATGDDYLQSL